MSSTTEWNAEGYASISDLQSAMAAQVLGLLYLSGTEHVLDIGCGDGKVTAQVATRVPQGKVVGVDPSGEMIAYASKHFGSETYPNLRFQVADARRLNFHSQFDWIVSLNALHWVPDQDSALHSIFNALKPGGIAQLRLVPKGERKSLEDTIEETRQSSKWHAYFQNFADPYLHLTPAEYTAAAKRSGLDVIKVNATSNSWDFHSRAAFENFGSVTFAAWTKLLPEEKKAAFVNDVLDRYLGSTGENKFLFYQMDVTAKRP